MDNRTMDIVYKEIDTLITNDAGVKLLIDLKARLIAIEEAEANEMEQYYKEQAEAVSSRCELDACECAARTKCCKD